MRARDKQSGPRQEDRSQIIPEQDNATLLRRADGRELAELVRLNYLRLYAPRRRRPLLCNRHGRNDTSWCECVTRWSA
jgi:hypothetical protein